TWTGRSRPNVDHACAPKKWGSVNLVEITTPTVGASIVQKSPHRSHWRISAELTSASFRAIARSTRAVASPPIVSAGTVAMGPADYRPALDRHAAVPAIGGAPPRWSSAGHVHPGFRRRRRPH